MIKYVNGNFFDYKADIRVNTVNCVGVMGAGAALQFKKKYPKMYTDYAKACKNGKVAPGIPHVWQLIDMFKELTIINFPTKIHWKNPSEYEYIDKGLNWLKQYLKEKNNITVTLPALGCGHGGLDWKTVKRKIEDSLGDLEINILVFEPSSSTNIQLDKDLLDKLKNKKIEILGPDDKYYPKYLKGRSSIKFYYIGNLELIKKNKLSILINSKSEDREKNALKSLLNSLPHKDFVFMINYNSSFEIDIVKEILNIGFKAIIALPYGILNLSVRKDLKDLWDYKNILVISMIKPEEKWKNYNCINSLKFCINLSKTVLINSLNYEKIKIVEKELKSYNNEKFYINYWNHNIDFYENISAQKIGLNPKTKKPNTDKLISTLTIV